MARTKIVNDVVIPYTAEEETARDAEEQTWADGAAAREMTSIREHRDSLLTETDWMALGDVTMSDAWKTYRQKLRDIPASNTTYADVTWPTKPS
jgi:hypothetical protein